MFSLQEHPFHSTTTLPHPIFNHPVNLLQTNAMPHPYSVKFHSLPLPLLRYTHFLKDLNGIHARKHTISMAHLKNNLSRSPINTTCFKG